MTKNIRRKDWAGFCREFNDRNRFRTFKAGDPRKKEFAEALFIGVSLLKKGRKIEGLGLYAGCDRPDQPAELVAKVIEPDKIVLDRDDSGNDQKLEIVAGNGAKLAIELSGQADIAPAEPLLQRLAHNIYESRGRTDGGDQNDWFEARKRLEQIAQKIS